MRSALALFAALSVVWCCLRSTPLTAQVPAGERLLSFQVDTAENQDFDAAYQMALDAGMNAVHQAFWWSDLEPVPEQIGGDIYALLDVANTYYPAFDTAVELNISVINTVRREVPSDLEAVAFDDPVFIARFKTLLDSLFAKIPNVTLAALNIGNEHGRFLAARPDELAAYTRFFEAVKPHAEMRYAELHGGADLRVGMTFTYGALMDDQVAPKLAPLHASADVLSVNYYGIDSGFNAKPPATTETDLLALADRYPDRTIYLTEVGYPSSPVVGSSEALQAAFIEHVFAAWDARAEQIPYLSFFKLTDWSQATVDALGTYYGLPNSEAFKEYLRTLGLRTYPGTGADKAAYETLLQEAAARGFISPRTSTRPASAAPVSVQVEAVYPHPVYTEASIRLTLPAPQHLDVGITDIRGRRVRTLVSSVQPSGTRTFTWHPDALPAGLYFVTVRAGRHRVSRPLLLMR